MPPAIAASAKTDGWQMEEGAAETNSKTRHTARADNNTQQQPAGRTTQRSPSPENITACGKQPKQQSGIAAKGGTAQERGSWLGFLPLSGSYQQWRLVMTARMGIVTCRQARGERGQWTL